MGEPSAAQSYSKGEGHLFQVYLGEDWAKVRPNISARFSQDPTPDKPIFYHGTMSQLRASKIGQLMGYSIYWTGALQPFNATDIPVSITVSAKYGMDGVCKERLYLLNRKKPFRFFSNMHMRGDELFEYVGGGFGMKIAVSVNDGNLEFRDDGYFIKVCGIHIPLPRLFSPGHTYLLHQDISATQFRIIIRITHPLFGEMYYQEGIFNHASEPLV